MVPAGQASELHVVGVYEPACSAEAPQWPFECLVPHEPIVVVVEPRPRPVVLALMAYEAVTWRIEVRPGAQVARVLTSGYETQSVEGVRAAIVETLPIQTYAYGWEVAHNVGGGSYWQAMADIRAATGLVESSFQGCYTGARFTIPYAAHPPTTCEPSPVTGDEGVVQAAVEFPECAAVVAESAVCISILDGGPALVGADSGAICLLASAKGGVSPDSSAASVGWLGEVLYRCTYGEGLVRIDLRTGAQERLEMPCEAVTDDDGTLLVAPGDFAGPAEYYAVYRVNGYQGLLAAEASRVPSLSIGNSRLAAHDGLLYSAWHAGDAINVNDLTTGAVVRQVTLTDYSGWIFGLDVADDGRLFVAGMDDEGTLLMIFDVQSGARVGEHRLGRHWGASGLACRARGIAPPPPPSSTTTTCSAPTTTTSTTIPCGRCIRSGCSGHICADHGVTTTCEWWPWYACYRTGRCERQPNGQCGWTPTPELLSCLQVAGGRLITMPLIEWPTPTER